MLHEENPIAKSLCWPPSNSFRISERMYSLKSTESDLALLYLMRSCNFGASFMKPSELPGARRLYRLTNHALAQIRELWQYAGEDELPPDSLLQAQVEAVRILRIDVPLSANRQFQLFCSEHFPGLADILDCLAADQLWALLSMRVQLANSDQLQAQSAAVRFGGLGRRYVLVAFNDRPVGLYRTPMAQASCQRLAQSSPPFPGKRSASP
jgi:hypothetical protein